MATLTFNQVGDKYVAEFEATSDFAIHIERNESGFLYMEQRSTSTGEYAATAEASFNYEARVIDTVIRGVIIPMHIRIKSKVMPTMAVVTYPQA